MPTYYLDPAASGSNNGTSWTDAWQTMQRAVDGTDGTQPVAGDTIYCRGSETVATAVAYDLTGADGSLIKWIGTNSSGVVDGTKFTLTTGSGSNDALTFDSVEGDYSWFENFEFTTSSGTGSGISFLGVVNETHWVNCDFHGFASNYGINGLVRIRASLFHKCRWYDCSVGFYRPHVDCRFINCQFYGNTSYGLEIPNGYCTCLNCTFHDNGGDGAWAGQATDFINCVSYGNTGEGFRCSTSRTFFINCRSVNNGGNNFESFERSWAINCYADDASLSDYASVHRFEIGEVDTNIAAGTDTNYGMTDPANNDFTLASDASLRNVEFALDATNSAFMSAGLMPEEPAGGGGASTGAANKAEILLARLRGEAR